MGRPALLFAMATLTAACGATPTPRTAAHAPSDGNPLGPSYVLVPLPGEDDSLLGRVLPAAPQAGRSLEETARANPCAEHLEAKKETPLASTFEYAEELTGNASAGAMLGTFGFSADARKATHFVYKLGTDKRASVVDKAGYAACCAEKGCGYGYVSALIHGSGDYATGEESSASGGVDIPAVASASGEVSLKVLNKRKVSGFIAAVVTITDRSATQQLGPLGIAEKAGISETSASETTKTIYEKEKITIVPDGSSWSFVKGSQVGGGTEDLAENVFAERYREVTGSGELDDLVSRRNTGGLVVLGGVMAVGAGGVAVGAATFGDGETAIPVFPMVFGGLLLVGAGVPFFILLGDYDGSTTSHYLTERDAQIYVRTYNRALLRRTVREVEKADRETMLPLPAEGPMIGFGPAGFAGTF